jgi:nicotinamidase-related amidase
VSLALRDLVAPESTAILTCEMQRGIIGDLATIPQLRDEVVNVNLVHHAHRLLVAARRAGIRIVHNTYGVRADLAGLAVNTRQMAAALKASKLIVQGEAEAELLPQLGPEPQDIVLHRIHGYTPFTGTELDSVLRNMGITTVVPIGVSLNECVLGTSLSAADLGYRIVLPADAVVGFPREYGRQVIEHTLAAIATISSVEDIIGAWLSLDPPIDGSRVVRVSAESAS